MMYELRDKQTPYWFTNDEVSRIQESLGAVFLEKVKGGLWEVSGEKVKGEG